MDLGDRMLDELGGKLCGKTASGSDAYCQNGSKCFINKSKHQGLYCDCNSNFSMQRGAHAGKYCEYKSTFYCVLNLNTGMPLPNSKSFCTNSGTCKKIVEADESHEGCRCPDGFEGEFCEYSATSLQRKSISAKLAGIAMFSIALGIVFLVSLMVFRFYKQRKLERDLALTANCATAELKFDVTYNDDDLDEYSSHGKEIRELDDSSSLINDDRGRSSVEITAKRKEGNFYTSTQLEDKEIT